MAVRRLAPKELQLKDFAFTPENLEWARGQLTKYPDGRQASAVIPLLWKAQEQAGGWVPEAAIRYVADLLDMAHIRVMEIATFYTMFNLAPVGRFHVQLCGTTPCRLRGAEDLIHVCEKRIGHQFDVTPDGALSWVEVECLGACVNAPMAQINYDFYEDLTPEILTKILDDLAAGKEVKPGPQIDRQYSAPEGGPTTLLDSPSISGSGGIAAAEPLTDAAPKKPTAEANQREAPANVDTLVKTAAKDGISARATEKALTDDAPVSDAHKPTLLAEARGGVADDLKLIWGVGPKLEAMLHRMGVFHFDQVASWTEMNLRWVDQNLEGFKGRAVRDKWIEQGRKLASGWRPASGVGEKPGD
ncbi:MAG: NADH-quinone oxidoreductase subunit NuoE [Pseudorhodoplanes sp.]|uniref:NADH-quinone oxidoreductase subunit NuoE n=1 Tax=Pseudorhodoplanes sp. TaxID=1934341 RepID=UPI003D0B0BD6